MSISGFNPELIPVDVRVDEAMIRVKFQNGLELATPVSRFPRLERATPEQRKQWRLIGKGDGIHWPDADEDISVRGLFEGSKPAAAPTIEQVPALIAQLYQTTECLDRIFPGRPFTPDGHLVGSIGEVVAEYIYDLKLEPCSTPRVDARTQDGRTVQIKLTGQNGAAYGIRWSQKDELPIPDLLLCLKLTATGFIEIYNGNFPINLLRQKKDQKNGQIPLAVSRLRALNPSLLPQKNSFDKINRWFAAQFSDVA